MKLLSDRIQEFMDWLTESTDVGEFDQSVIDEIHKKLIVFMISDEISRNCPRCKSDKITKIYRPEIYEFSYICKDCEEGFN